MKEQIEQIKQKSIEEIGNSKDLKSLEELRIKYLGKKGELTAVLRGMKDLSPEERPVIGNLVNEVKEKLENLIQEKEEAFKKEELNKRLEAEKIDVTLPGNKLKRGSLHPVNRIIEDIEDLFVSMGYDVVEGPELETDEFCFERLNLPKGHPARDMQDSFYITDEYLLRTQTSAVQARTMVANTEKSPIRIITAGKTYPTIHGRAEDYAKDAAYREKYDLCVSRAVANLATLSEYCLPYVKVGGMFIPYKSGEIDEEVKGSKKAVKVLGGEIEDVVKFELPGTDIGRSFVKIHKVKNTAKKYPRKAGMPSREPIV